jgi:hypothetical protein
MADDLTKVRWRLTMCELRFARQGVHLQSRRGQAKVSLRARASYVALDELKRKCSCADCMHRTPIKKVHSALTARLAQLEAALEAHNIELPPHPTVGREQTSRTCGEAADQDEHDQATQNSANGNTVHVRVPPTVSQPPLEETQSHLDGHDATDLDPVSDPSLALRATRQSFDGSGEFGMHVNQPAPDQSNSETNHPVFHTSAGAAEADMNADPDVLSNMDFMPFPLGPSNGGDFDFDFSVPLHMNADSPPSPRLTTSYTPAPSSDYQAAASDDITNSLSARMGSLQIAEDGQMRYYGVTSNLHLYHSGLHSLSRSTIRHVATEGAQALHRAGLDQPVDEAVEMRLTQLYFTWEDPAIHVVDEEVFYLEKKKWRAGNPHASNSYYSETLNNAICAIGASLASGTGERLGVPEPAPEFFSSRAKALLDVEMDSPSIATVQALVIMSASEAAFTRDARGWLYSGMAVRLSADLGLHLDVMEQYRKKILTQRDLDVRRTTFWGVFIQENMWNCYVGRCWSGISIRDISISRPLRELDGIRRRMWKAYPLPSEGAEGTAESQFQHQALLDPLEACTDAVITICELMRRVNRTLYTGRKIPVKELTDFLSAMKHEFSEWLEKLPDELRVNLADASNRVYIPHILQLHMQYYAALIFLFRPYFSRDMLDPDSLDPEGRRTRAFQGQVPATVRADCISAAHNMTEMLRCFRKQHSLRYTNIQIVHLIFTASLVHIYNACTPHDSNSYSQAALDDLQFCCQSLGEIGQTYGNATRALEVIILVKREWQRMAAVRRSAKRSISAATGSSDLHDLTTSNADHLAQRPKRRTPSTSTVYGRPNMSAEPHFTAMPSPFETYHMVANVDRSRGPASAPAQRQSGGGDMYGYDAWQLLQWTDLRGGNPNPLQ